MIKINARQIEMIAIGKDMFGPITDVRISRHLGYVHVEFFDGETLKHEEDITDVKPE